MPSSNQNGNIFFPFGLVTTTIRKLQNYFTGEEVLLIDNGNHAHKQ
jgi:hypothetical protein